MANDVTIEVSSQGYDIEVILDATYIVQTGGGGGANAVLYSGNPVANQIPVFVSTNTVEGNANLVYNGSALITPLVRTTNLEADHIFERTPGDGIAMEDTVNVNHLKNVGTFVSGLFGSGWQLEYTGGFASLTVDNLYVRGILAASELQIREINHVGGSLVLSVANGKVDSFTGTGPYRLYFDTKNGANPVTFAVDDYVWAQVWTGAGINAFRGYVTAKSTNYIDVTATSGAPWVGMELVQVGHASNADRQNIIYLTAADTNNPYIDMLAGVTDGAFDGHTKVRIGNLTGITDVDFGVLSGYGLYANNIYLKGQIVMTGGSVPNASVTGLGDLALLDDVAWEDVGSKPGYFATPTGSGMFIDATHMGYYDHPNWKTYMDSSGNFSLGDYGGGNAGITWTQGTGVLNIRGAIVMSSGSVDWDLVGDKPSYLGVPASTPGLFITSTYLGYYDGIEFTSYIDDAGNCKFTGVSQFGNAPGAGGGLTLEYNTITERTVNGMSYITFNNVGYNGGTTQFRGFQVCDGKGEGSGHNLLFIMPYTGGQSITMGDITVTEETLLFEVFGSQKVYNDLTVYDNLTVSGYAEIGEYLQVSSSGAKIGGSGGPATSAILELSSTSKALLVPRMTTSQKLNDITNPVNGMIVYDTVQKQFSGYVDGVWVKFTMW